MPRGEQPETPRLSRAVTEDISARVPKRLGFISNQLYPRTLRQYHISQPLPPAALRAHFKSAAVAPVRKLLVIS